MSIRQKHEKLPKNARPSEGGVYTLSHNGTAMYSAEITKYDGGCWATVRVTEPFNDAYAVNDSFDIRVAMYEYQAVSGVV
ncbi:MAG: hypothetical protein EAZ92_07310 [Candidatus Kapaibacterium sp.]|nr:MAG: hypothetical protein EAZ92_07310 [Candidatus Kapabacteria bacterium]